MTDTASSPNAVEAMTDHFWIQGEIPINEGVDLPKRHRSSYAEADAPSTAPNVLGIVQEYIRERVDLNGMHPCDVGLQTYAMRIVGLLTDAIVPDESSGEAPLLPRLNRNRRVGSTESVHFKTVKPVQATVASHLNYVACDTDSWEQAAVFQIEKLAKDGLVRCYARNDRLEFNIPYELYGNPASTSLTSW